MDTDTRNLLIGNIEEMVLDEGKLVTYLSLSRQLCLHVNDGKSLLTDFIAKCRKNAPDVTINVNMLLSGIDNSQKTHTLICSESELPDWENKLKIVYKHVYSVGKGKPVVDKAALASVSTFDDFLSCIGFVKNDLCAKRSLEEMNSLKQKSFKAIVLETSKPTPKQSNINNKTCKEKLVKTEMSPKKSPVKNHPQSTSKATSKTNLKSGIANFFNKDNQKPKNGLKEDVKQIKAEVVKQSKTESVQKEITKIKKEPIEEKIKTVNKENSDTGKSKSDCKSIKQVVKKEVDEKPAKKTKSETIKIDKKLESKKNNRTKSLSDIKKNAKVDKKRKRVIQVSDSEDSADEKDPFMEPEEPMDLSDDEVIPPTPDPPVVKVNSTTLNPRKRRKIIDKTYTDEDGYILTKKEEVYESCSEDESDKKENKSEVNVDNKEELPKKKEEHKKLPVVEKTGKRPKKKLSPPQKGKQATLTGFFKKK